MNRQRGEGLGCHSTARARWEHKEDFSRSPTSPPWKGREGVLAFQAAWLHGDGRRNLRKKFLDPPTPPPGGGDAASRSGRPLLELQAVQPSNKHTNKIQKVWESMPPSLLWKTEQKMPGRHSFYPSWKLGTS